MSRQHIACSYVRLLYEFLASRGIDAPALLGPLPAPESGLIPLYQWQALLQQTDSRLGEPAIGLRIAAGIGPQHFGVAGYAGRTCATLADALLRLERYQGLVYDVNPVRVRQDDDHLLLEWGTEHGRPGQLVDETGIAALVQLARTICGQALQPSEVHFVNPSPPDLEAYQDFFGCPVYFAQPTTRLALPLSYLHLPLQQADPALLKLLDEQAENVLHQRGHSSFTRSCQQVLIRLLQDGRSNVEDLARQMNRSPRTLQRHLQAENSSFQRLLDDTRRQLAEHYLRDTTIPLGEVAALLGFSEQSALSRAFRQWYGTPPLAWRRSRLTGRHLPTSNNQGGTGRN